MSKIATGLLAKVLGYAFAGYGLACDAHFLKVLLQQARFQIARVTSFLSEHEVSGL